MIVRQRFGNNLRLCKVSDFACTAGFIVLQIADDGANDRLPVSREHGKLLNVQPGLQVRSDIEVAADSDSTGFVSGQRNWNRR